MLTLKELDLLSPYLEKGTAVNMQVQETKAKKEVLLEFSTGERLVGDLKKSPFVMMKMSGLTTLASYFARGKYGSNSWRGNCSGLLIKDLLQHFKPDTFSDLAVGSGTSIDVAKELGYTSGNTTFSDLNPKYGGIDISAREGLDFPLTDFIFYHPPYYVPEGSAMPKYSGNMWGDAPDARDGSQISNFREFMKWFNQTNCNLYNLLKTGGRLAILMGDSRCKSRLYSMFKEMSVLGELEHVIIKEQHNNFSDNIKYSGKFIPIQHEYLVILKKGSNPLIVPISYVKHTTRDLMQSEKVTWQTLVAMTLESNGGKLKSSELLSKLQNHPKAASNNNVDAKLRQVVNTFSKTFRREGEYVCLAA